MKQTRPTPSARALTLLAAMIAAVFAVTSCAPSLPTDGPVGTSEIDALGEPETYFQPDPPVPGAEPEEIIRGFMQAHAGHSNDYAVAREYMTESAAQNWQPGGRTTIYQQEPSFLPGGDPESDEAHYQVQLQVHAVINPDGTMTTMGGTTNEQFDIQLEEVDGEWRISEAPNGKMLDISIFNQVYSAQTLYFYDPQLRYAVPDLRFFVRRPGMPAEIVSRMLEGPAPWLEPAVVSAFPEGASLSRSAVPIDNQVATVDLDAAVQEASPRERLLMSHQLNMALSQLPDVREVELTVGDSELEVPAPDELPEDQQLNIESNPSTTSIQVGIQDDQLVRQNGITTLSIGGLPDLSSFQPQAPAAPRETTEEVFAFLNGSADELYLVRPNENAELVLEAEGLIRPSMDNFGWTWTASHDEDQGATIQVVAHDETVHLSATQVPADWLEQRSVSSLRIAQDGTRAVLVVDDAGQQTLYLASVIRDSDGTPRGLGQPVPLESSQGMEEVRWSNSNEVIVWDSYDGAEDTSDPQRYPLRIGFNGEREFIEPAISWLLNISAGEGQSNIYAETVDVPFWNLSGSDWESSEDVEVRDLAFPG